MSEAWILFCLVIATGYAALVSLVSFWACLAWFLVWVLFWFGQLLYDAGKRAAP